jgi:hypothetical protein
VLEKNYFFVKDYGGGKLLVNMNVVAFAHREVAHTLPLFSHWQITLCILPTMNNIQL